MAGYVEVEKQGKVIGKIIQSDDMKVTVEAVDDKYKKELEAIVKPTYTYIAVDEEEEEAPEESDEDEEESESESDDMNKIIADGVREVPTDDPIWLMEIGNHPPKGFIISLPKQIM
jgi:acyl-CoA hydrolase